MTVFHAMTPVEAQEMVDGHPVISATDRCACCDVSTCPARVTALRVLAANDRLPKRRPGATRPELIGARRVQIGLSR